MLHIYFPAAVCGWLRWLKYFQASRSEALLVTETTLFRIIWAPWAAGRIVRSKFIFVVSIHNCMSSFWTPSFTRLGELWGVSSFCVGLRTLQLSWEDCRGEELYGVISAAIWGSLRLNVLLILSTLIHNISQNGSINCSQRCAVFLIFIS